MVYIIRHLQSGDRGYEETESYIKANSREEATVIFNRLVDDKYGKAPGLFYQKVTMNKVRLVKTLN